MAGTSPLFALLANESNLAADAALLEALSGADEPSAYHIVRTLIQRKTRPGLRGLVDRYHQLPPSIKTRLQKHAAILASALRETSQSKSDRSLLNMIELIEQGTLHRSSYLLDFALRHRDPHIREEAAGALYRLCQDLYRRCQSEEPVEHSSEEEREDELQQRQKRVREVHEDRHQTAVALDSVISSFHVHLHPRALEPALWFVEDLDARFWAALTAPASKVARAATTLLEHTNEPRHVAFAILSMKHGSFRSTVARLFEDPLDPVFLNAWFRQGWRLCQPKIKRGMTCIKEAACLSDPDLRLLPLGREAQRHVPRWILSTGATEDQKRACLREMLHGSESTGQRAALLALVQLKDERSTTLLRQTAGQGKPEMAAIARLELARRQPQEYPPQILLEQFRGIRKGPMPIPPPVQQRGKVSATGSTQLFEEHWVRFDHYAPAQRDFQTKALFVKHPECVEMLRERLDSDDLHDKLRCLTMVSAAELAEEFRDELHQLSNATDPGLRSAAVACLGQLKDGTSRRLIHNALVDGDARVQANAVEAVGDHPDAREYQELITKLTSPNNRVRANAVRTLLKLGVREAAQTLLIMLSHTSRAQRVSALWLIEQMGLHSLMQRVSVLADLDQDENVRTRARAIRERIQAEPVAVAEQVEATS